MSPMEPALLLMVINLGLRDLSSSPWQAWYRAKGPNVLTRKALSTDASSTVSSPTMGGLTPALAIKMSMWSMPAARIRCTAFFASASDALSIFTMSSLASWFAAATAWRSATPGALSSRTLPTTVQLGLERYDRAKALPIPVHR